MPVHQTDQIVGIYLIDEVRMICKIVNNTAFKKAVIFFVIATIVTVLGTTITYFMNPDLKGIME